MLRKIALFAVTSGIAAKLLKRWRSNHPKNR